ncbi:putative ribonuclease H-like domain-containing protein, partial [Tanacetum coccineum]
FAEIVDFLRGSNLRYALTANPTIYDSLVKQFWQSAVASTREDGSLEISATVDTKRYIISEASIRDSLQLEQIENQLNQKVKIIRSDNGTEFKNRVMLEFCGEKGIKQEFSNARTPQQNGVAERMNRTLIEAARTMLADSHLPTTFWAEAVNTACYTFNSLP